MSPLAMRFIKVKPGVRKYRLKGEDDGVVIGEITVNYTPKSKSCGIDVTRLGATMESVSIGVV